MSIQCLGILKPLLPPYPFSTCLSWILLIFPNQRGLISWRRFCCCTCQSSWAETQFQTFARQFWIHKLGSPLPTLWSVAVTLSNVDARLWSLCASLEWYQFCELLDKLFWTYDKSLQMNIRKKENDQNNFLKRFIGFQKNIRRNDGHWNLSYVKNSKNQPVNQMICIRM